LFNWYKDTIILRIKTSYTFLVTLQIWYKTVHKTQLVPNFRGKKCWNPCKHWFRKM